MLRFVERVAGIVMHSFTHHLPLTMAFRRFLSRSERLPVGGPAGSRVMYSPVAVAVFVALAAISTIKAAQFQAAGKLRQLQFSLDGKYVLAQSDTEISIIQVDGFQVYLRLRAVGVTRAQFTPDSREVTFVSAMSESTPWEIRTVRATPHVERWRIADRSRVAFTPVPQLICGTLVLARTANTFACGSPDGTLRVIDVMSGETILEKRKFAQQRLNDFPSDSGLRDGLPKVDLGMMRIEFSPDGRFLIAVPILAEGSKLIWDVFNKCTVKPGGKLRSVNRTNFDFLAGDQLVTSWSICSRCDMSGVGIVAVPSGTMVFETKIPIGRTFRTADPAYLVIRPNPRLKDPRSSTFTLIWKPTIVIELRTGQTVPVGSGAPLDESTIFDVLGTFSVTELGPGEIGLWERGHGLKASTALRRSN